nr:MAG TPA: helix-turn-helix domain protein [Caudoviricetes sp.]
MIYENIEHYAKKRGMTITELERQSGLSRGHIGKWKSKNEPTISALQKVADVLGVTVNTLLKERKE